MEEDRIQGYKGLLVPRWHRRKILTSPSTWHFGAASSGL